MESEPGPADERAAGDDRGPVGPAGKAADVDRPRDQAPAFDGPTDPDRRAFFRSLSRDALRAAVRVAPAGLAGGSSDWLAALAGTEADRRSGTPIGAGRGSALAGAPGEPAITPAGIGYRSPYRIEDGTLLVLDQLRFPEVIAEVACEDASDVARLMREERVRGPVLAQVAAYGLWLAAERRRALPPPDRLAALRTAAEALRAGRPTMPAVAAALERLLDAAARTADASGAVAADAIRLAADSVASDALTGHLAIGRAGTDLLARPADRPLTVLTIDDTGPLSGGTVGTAMGVVQTLAAEGRPVEVWQAETEPSRAGARLGAWELALADVPATVVPDATTGALLAAGRVDVV
ncbi:MAG TPA: hypothetical protein VFW86_05380, partial [Candidatus Limnocylindrales bacterium]|nr:hypothetical protein [Candidatus Limnocylindrales bacterium]